MSGVMRMYPTCRSFAPSPAPPFAPLGRSTELFSKMLPLLSKQFRYPTKTRPSVTRTRSFRFSIERTAATSGGSGYGSGRPSLGPRPTGTGISTAATRTPHGSATSENLRLRPRTTTPSGRADARASRDVLDADEDRFFFREQFFVFGVLRVLKRRFGLSRAFLFRGTDRSARAGRRRHARPQVPQDRVRTHHAVVARGARSASGARVRRRQTRARCPPDRSPSHERRRAPGAAVEPRGGGGDRARSGPETGAETSRPTAVALETFPRAGERVARPRAGGRADRHHPRVGRREKHAPRVRARAETRAPRDAVLPRAPRRPGGRSGFLRFGRRAFGRERERERQLGNRRDETEMHARRNQTALDVGARRNFFRRRKSSVWKKKKKMFAASS